MLLSLHPLVCIDPHPIAYPTQHTHAHTHTRTCIHTHMHAHAHHQSVRQPYLTTPYLILAPAVSMAISFPPCVCACVCVCVLLVVLILLPMGVCARRTLSWPRAFGICWWRAWRFTHLHGTCSKYCPTSLACAARRFSSSPRSAGSSASRWTPLVTQSERERESGC
jgi:hypothetical protein